MLISSNTSNVVQFPGQNLQQRKVVEQLVSNKFFLILTGCCNVLLRICVIKFSTRKLPVSELFVRVCNLKF